jgi:predicted nucleic acid-binding protein
VSTLSSLLDTNIVSQRIKPNPDEKVVGWLSRLPDSDSFLSVVSILELRTGIDLLPAGRKRRDLESWLVDSVRRGYRGRILPVSEEVADMCGRLIAKAKSEGSTPDVNDALIAATARVHGLTVATLNRTHFERLGVELVEF